MKILLVGEFSGLHTNLKEGLVELGCEVQIISSGDGWKKFDSDRLLSPHRGIFARIKNRVHDFRVLSNISGYDVVQFISPFMMIPTIFPRLWILKRIIKRNKLVTLVAAGGDSYFWRNGPNNLKYGPFDDADKYDDTNFINYLRNEETFAFNKKFAKLVHKVIPIMHEYECSYKGQYNLTSVIPLPMNVNKIEYFENKPTDRLVVMHGLNRYGFKGTHYVEEAFDYLNEKYPNELELIIDGKMPIEEYLKLMKRTNVVIDQINSHSLGMNGVYALAMGKVVVGGAEPESLDCIGADHSPVINVKPDTNDLIRIIEKLLNEKDKIQDMGINSRKYAVKFHSHRTIAEKYLGEWLK